MKSFNCIVCVSGLWQLLTESKCKARQTCFVVSHQPLHGWAVIIHYFTIQYGQAKEQHLDKHELELERQLVHVLV